MFINFDHWANIYCLLFTNVILYDMLLHGINPLFTAISAMLVEFEYFILNITH